MPVNAPLQASITWRVQFAVGTAICLAVVAYRWTLLQVTNRSTARRCLNCLAACCPRQVAAAVCSAARRLVAILDALASLQPVLRIRAPAGEQGVEGGAARRGRAACAEGGEHGAGSAGVQQTCRPPACLACLAMAPCIPPATRHFLPLPHTPGLACALMEQLRPHRHFGDTDPMSLSISTHYPCRCERTTASRSTS